jgi:hypothetical protein
LVKLPPDVLQELVFGSLLLLVAEANVQSQIDTLVSSADATPQTEGAVACRVPRRLLETLYRTCPYRWHYHRLDGNETLDAELLDDMRFQWFVACLASSRAHPRSKRLSVLTCRKRLLLVMNCMSGLHAVLR